MPERSSNLIRAVNYTLSYEDGRPTVNRGGHITQTGSEALEELRHFMDRIIGAYRSHQLPQRAESAQSFLENSVFVNAEQLSGAAAYFCDELASSVRGGEDPIVLHVNSEDVKDQQVGSSEYIASLIYDKMRSRYHISSDTVPFCSIKQLRTNTALAGRPLYIFDDWIVSGGQMHKLINQLSELANDARFRFVALRENWRDKTTEEIPFPAGSVHYYSEAGPLQNIVEGPSIIGAHSSVNIGWQNRLITFGFDLAYLRQTPITLPTLGDIVRVYRTRESMPHFYSHPPENDLVSWRLMNRLDPDGFTEFTLNTILKFLRTNRGTIDNKPTI